MGLSPMSKAVDSSPALSPPGRSRATPLSASAPEDSRPATALRAEEEEEHELALKAVTGEAIGNVIGEALALA
jgi:hypothetical protein